MPAVSLVVSGQSACRRLRPVLIINSGQAERKKGIHQSGNRADGIPFLYKKLIQCVVPPALAVGECQALDLWLGWCILALLPFCTEVVFIKRSILFPPGLFHQK